MRSVFSEKLLLYLAVGVLCTHTRAGINVLRDSRFMSNKDENKGDQRADERSIAGVTENEVQHDIIVYWAERLLGNPDIYITLKGSISQAEQVVHLQQNSATPASSQLLTAKPLVYRVMIQPVPGLDNLVVSNSNGTLPYFDQILIVINNEKVYEFLPSSTRRLIVRALLLNDTRNAKLVNEYQAKSIRFMENGMCVNPLDSSLPPTIGTKIVLRYNCGTLDTFFTITPDRRLQHIASGLYVDADIDGLEGAIPVTGGSSLGSTVDSAGGNEVQLPINGGLSNDDSFGDGGFTSYGGEHSDINGDDVDATGDVINDEPNIGSHGLNGDEQIGFIHKGSPSMHDNSNDDVKVVHVKPTSTDDGSYSTAESFDNDFGSEPADVNGDGTPMVDNMNTMTSHTLSSDVSGNVKVVYVKPTSTDDGNYSTANSFDKSEPDVNGDGAPMVDNMGTESSHSLNSDVSGNVKVVYVKPARTDDGNYSTANSFDNDFKSEPADVNGDGTPIVDNVNTMTSHTVNSDVSGNVKVVYVKPTSTDEGNYSTANSFDKSEPDVNGDGAPMVDNMDTESEILAGEEIGRRHNAQGAVGLRGTKWSHPFNPHRNVPFQGQRVGHLRRFLYFAPKYNLHSKYKSPVVAEASMKNYAKRNDIIPSNQTLNLYLSSTSNLQFNCTSDPENFQAVSSGTNQPLTGLSQNVRSWKVRLTKFDKRNGGKLRKGLPRVEMVCEDEKRALTDLHQYLRESQSGLCLGYLDKQVVLMPCKSVPSSVEFCGNSSGGGSTCPTVGQAQNPVMGQPQNPVMAPSVTESTTPKPYTVTQEPYTTTVSAVLSPCGGSCSTSCYPSCTQSCCSSGLSSSASGSCGIGCSSSCYPSCTSSCCGSGYNQGTSQSSCPSSCASASQCPSSQCPQSCCSGQSQGGSYMSPSLSQSQICPSGCKKHCRPSCPFNCC